MLTRKDLKPGMIVLNTKSGKEAMVLGKPENPKRLRRAHRDFVTVRGIFGDKRLRTWALENVQLSPD